jgi:hypothetical protein
MRWIGREDGLEQRRERVAHADLHRLQEGGVGKSHSGAEARDAGDEEPVRVQLAGPFQSQGDGELPKFALDAAFDGAGQSLKAGATSTGEQGFLSFRGTDYVLDPPVFKRSAAGLSRRPRRERGTENQSFASLGMDPRKWLTDPKIAW